MKIKVFEEQQTVRFGELIPGDTFKIRGGNRYMKTDGVLSSGFLKNAVRLVTGSHECFSDDEMVTPVYGTFVEEKA